MSSWLAQPVAVGVPNLWSFLFHQVSQVLFQHTVLSFAKRVRHVSIGHICGQLKVECAENTFVPSWVTTNVYIFIKMYLFRYTGAA